MVYPLLNSWQCVYLLNIGQHDVLTSHWKCRHREQPWGRYTDSRTPRARPGSALSVSPSCLGRTDESSPSSGPSSASPWWLSRLWDCSRHHKPLQTVGQAQGASAHSVPHFLPLHLQSGIRFGSLYPNKLTKTSPFSSGNEILTVVRVKLQGWSILGGFSTSSLVLYVPACCLVSVSSFPFFPELLFLCLTLHRMRIAQKFLLVWKIDQIWFVNNYGDD